MWRIDRVHLHRRGRCTRANVWSARSEATTSSGVPTCTSNAAIRSASLSPRTQVAAVDEPPDRFPQIP
jgi:hypothetical protein